MAEPVFRIDDGVERVMVDGTPNLHIRLAEVDGLPNTRRRLGQEKCGDFTVDASAWPRLAERFGPLSVLEDDDGTIVQIKHEDEL